MELMIDGAVRPLVSVVIPCCNQAPFLGEAVRSATARCVRVEVIVVDDGSADHSAAVARGLDDARLIRQSHRGAAAARNRGLRAASGDFVIFLDAGDRLLPGAIDAAARELQAQPRCAMAYGRSAIIGTDGELWPAPEEPIVRSGHHAALLQTNLIWMPAMAIFRREPLAAAGGFAEGFDTATDYDLYLRLSRDASIHDHGRLVAACRRDRCAVRGAARLLRDTLTAMRRNRPDPSSALHAAWHEGYTRWQEVYGSQVVEEIRADVRDRAFADAWRRSLSLASLAPRVLLRELRQAAWLTAVRTVGPALGRRQIRRAPPYRFR